MFELEQVGKQSYYINSLAKIGIYKQNNSDIYLINSGNDKEAGKKGIKDSHPAGMENKSYHQYSF